MIDNRTLRLQIELPIQIAEVVSPAELEALGRTALVVRLYDLGKIGSGFGATLLGISRRAFLELLGQYGVVVIDETSLDD